MSRTVTISCPHCEATLTVDLEAGVVVHHERPAAPPSDRVDFETRLRQLEVEKRRASERMQEAMRSEKDRERLLADRFKNLLDKAKDEPDEGPKIRDIDLD